MQPKTIEITNREIRIKPGHEFDKDALSWIDDTLRHIFRYLSSAFHDESTAWVQANTTGVYMVEIDPQQQGTIRFANLADAQAYEVNFKSDPRIWS